MEILYYCIYYFCIVFNVFRKVFCNKKIIQIWIAKRVVTTTIINDYLCFLEFRSGEKITSRVYPPLR